MARRKTDFGATANELIKQLTLRGASADAIAARLAAAGIRASPRTINRRMNEVRPRLNANLARTARTAKPAPVESSPELEVEGPVDVPPSDDEKATSKDRQIDELMSRSLAWRRIQAAIATALATYPTAAAAVVRALRAVEL